MASGDVFPTLSAEIFRASARTIRTLRVERRGMLIAWVQQRVSHESSMRYSAHDVNGAANPADEILRLKQKLPE